MKAKLYRFPERARGRAPTEPTDAELVATCARGDRAALGLLFDRHHAAVGRFLAHARGVDEVDDCVQTTFIKAFDAAGRFRGDAAVRTWLLGIAANVARRAIRADVRRKRLAALFGERQRLAGAEASGVRLVEGRDQVRRIAEAVEALPTEQRLAFVMCHVEGVRGVDAARALDVPEGTLYRRLHDARLRLRAALEGDR